MRIARGGFVVAVVPVLAALCFGAFMFVSVLLDPMYFDLVSYDTHRTLTGFVAPLALCVTLAVFGLLDALFVSAVATDDGFLAATGRVRANPWGLALWVGAFVVAFWPFRPVVLPQWTLGWVLEALPVLHGELGWVPVVPVVGAVAAVVALAAATFFLAPLTVVDGRSPREALAANLRLLRTTPVETAVAVSLGVASVLVGFLAVCLGVFGLAFALGIWIFGLVLLPFALVSLALGFACLAVGYAFARTLMVETYARGCRRLPDGSGNTSARAPIDPS
jgi:hypothetical protein